MKKLLWLSLLVIACVPSSAHAAITFRKDCTPNNQGSSVSSLTVSCGTTTAGDLLLIVGAEYNGSGGTTVPSCTSSGSNTYAILKAANDAFICYAANIGGGTETATVTFTGGTSFCVCMGVEFSGVKATSPLDVSAFQNSITTCTSCTLTAVTTTAANDLVVSVGGNGSTNNTFTAGSGYTISTNGQVSGGNQSGFVEYQAVTTATTYTPTVTITTTMSISNYTAAFFAAPPTPATTVIPKTTVLPNTTVL